MVSKKGYFFLSLILLLTVGCQKPKQGCKVLLDWYPNANHLPLFVGEKQGIFKKHGLNLELLILQDPPSTLSYLKTHQVDVALCYFPSAIKAFSKYPQFKIIGKLFDEPHYCLFSKKAKTFQDLSSCSIGTYGDVFSKAVINSLSKKNILFSKNLHSHGELMHLLYFNQIDVASGSINVEAIQLEDKLGYLHVFSWKDLNIPAHPEIVAVANHSFLEKNPTFESNFQKAVQESIVFCQNNPELVISWYFEMFPEKKRSKTWEMRSCLKTLDLFANSQILENSVIQDYVDWLENNTTTQPQKNCR